MKRMRRITALFLGLMMMVPSQGMTVLAGGLPAAESGGARIEETLPLEPLPEKSPLDGLTVIYWNPGGSLPAELTKAPAATASDAEPAEETETAEAKDAAGKVLTAATSSNAAVPAGSDRADGFTPEHPVKSLETALKQADRLVEEQGVDKSDITIYAMNPMEIPDGRMYVLNAGNIRIASWPGRTYDNDTVFYLNGGQLTLMNAVLESGDESADPEGTELVRVCGGSLQMGQGVLVDGRIVMDYRQKKEQTEWEKASASDAAGIKEATASNAAGIKRASASNWTEAGDAGAGFDIDNYILSTDENEWELLEDKSQASTWRDPVIELIDGFDGSDGGFLLEIRQDGSGKSVMLARTLYADELSEEEFAGFFRLAEAGNEWSLVPSSQETAEVRDTGAETLRQYYRSVSLAKKADELAEEEAYAGADDSSVAATVKTLSAVPLGSGSTIYWNPGPDLVIGGVTYFAGTDTGVAGGAPTGAFKSLKVASEAANGGTVICMQTVTLGADSGQYLWGNQDADGIFWAKSPSSATKVTVKPWETNLNPIFRVQEGETLGLENIILAGTDKEGRAVSTQAVICEGGDIVVGSGVTAETGYIQINGSSEPGKDLKDHPVKVQDADDGGKITLFFGGINDNLAYRYTDVAVPDGALADAAAVDPNSVGAKLLSRFQLELSNKGIGQGGNSLFDWRLRQDTDEDDASAVPQNLELYVDYYFDAVYLNGQEGSDTNYGATCRYPVKTFAKAKEILEREAVRSIAQRNIFAAAGMTKAELDKKYPVPSVIYLCGTVEVDASETWALTDITDYDGTTIRPELVSHTEIPVKEDGTPVHGLAKTLVKVASGGDLELKGMVIRNITDEGDSVTVRVADGGKLTVKDKTLLTGAQDAWDREETGISNSEDLKTKYARVTRGTHVWVEDGGVFAMPSDWTGSIERRGRGVYAMGSRAEVTMNGGVIRRNNGLDETQNQENQVKGAGVCLLGGASMTMDGGTVAENITSQYGGGIYLSGAGTGLTLKKGEVSANRMAKYTTSNAVNDTDRVTGYGIGIYAGAGTSLKLGTPSGADGDVRIEKNDAFRAKGVGILTDGTIEMYHTSLCNNTSDPQPNDKNNTGANYPSYGIGLYVSGSGQLHIEDSDVSENGARIKNGSGGKYEVAKGAGIYLDSSLKDNVIANCRINGNYSGIGNITGGGTRNVGEGGGIYARGKLEIRDSKISDNRACHGAGIFMDGMNNNTRAGLTVSSTKITGNQASNSAMDSTSVLYTSGRGGGMYLNQYVSFVLKDGSHIDGNSAGEGGGIFENQSSVEVTLNGYGTVPVTVNRNQAVSMGGGIYAQGSAVLYARHAEICDNQGSGIYGNSSGTTYLRDVRIAGNRGASNGGAVCITGTSSTSKLVLTDVEMEGNSAALLGGGIYISGPRELYFSETAPGRSSLSGNSAVSGGGVFCQSTGSGGIYLDLAEISNTATGQGSNIYHKSGIVRLLKGELKRPAGVGDDIYNIYFNTAAGNALSTVYLDPNQVTVEKKSQDDPKTVLLDTGSSYLVYYTAPKGAAHTLPIDLNTTVFNVGSVVIKPANTAEVKMLRVQESNVTRTELVTYTYTALQSVAENLDYSRGGILPRKTRMGAYRDSSNPMLTNAVLVGEGVYLASYGDDNRTGAGDTPENPVKTFAKAKQLLAQYITDAAADSGDTDGFSPYIYICGNVEIDGDETWELDYTAVPFDKDSNLKFWKDEEEYAASKGTVFDEEDGQTQIRRFTSFVKEPMITVGNNAAGKTAFTLDKIIIDGMADGVVTSDQGALSPVIQGNDKAEVTLKGGASVRDNYYYGISMKGGSLVLTGEEGDLNKQIRNIGGYGATLSGNASMEMRGYSRILKDKDGIPSGISRETGISAGSDSSVLMQDHSLIEGLSVGIRLYNPEIVELEDFAEILRCNRGMMADSGSTKNKIRMNMRPDAGAEDSAKLTGGTNGIFVEQNTSNLDLQMGKKAKIQDASNEGIYVYNMTGASILMQEDSSIRECSTGIAPVTVQDGFVIHLKDRAEIAGNRSYGIGRSSMTLKEFELIMEGDSRIGGNGADGIYIPNMTTSGGNYTGSITMKDQAVIGGTGAYATGQPDTGNNGSGISLFSSMKITMEGNAAVKDNKSNGILMNFMNSYPRGELTMSGDSVITGNSLYAVQSGSNSYNAWDITLKERAAIRDNKFQMLVGAKDNLYLKDSAFVSLPTDSADATTASITCRGRLFLDGTATVLGSIHLYTPENPVTMTKKAADPSKVYQLLLEQGFMGQIVVQPDDPDGISGGVTDLNDDPKQLPHFVKIAHAGEGLIADKILLEDGKNIILQANNDVYLSGKGNDANSGMTPDTPVRTFKQAKYLLENGRYTRGANIIICGEVLVYTNDLDWSFDAGGTVTNVRTGDTWKPVVTRWEKYTTGNLIATNSDQAVKLELSNITVDGGAEDGIKCITDNDAVLLYVKRYSTVKLGTGTVLQNNRLESTRGGAAAAAAVTITGGTLEIDGGMIKNTSVWRTKNTQDPAAVVACYCYSGTPGRFIMKSGSITGNRVKCDYGPAGVFAVNEDGFLWEMSGGTVSDNTLLTTRPADAKTNKFGSGSVLTVLKGNASMTGGAIRGNAGTRGSAIYDASSGAVVLSGGQIQNNINIDNTGAERPAVGARSAIYVAGNNFQLKGGGAAITDKFYLDSTKHVIKVSGNIYQSERLYDVYVNSQPQDDGTHFKKGSAVVVPDGVWLKDAAPYLANFRVLSNPYVLDRGQISREIDADIVAGVMEHQCLVLMQAVFLDSVKGDDTNDGTTPAKAAASFTRAKHIGETGEGGDTVRDYYIIYISGRAVNTADEDVWSIAAPAYLCRYTGFDIFDENGLEISDSETYPYYGSLIEPDPAINPNLTLKNINVYGRRNIDTSMNTGESLVMVHPGVTVTMEKEEGGNTILGRNRNNGGYSDPEQDGFFVQLSSKGGAVHVQKGGVFNLSGGSILDVEATEGSAVYLAADETNPALFGALYLTGTPSVTGKIFLDGTKTVTAAYIGTNMSFRPAEKIEVEVRNDYHGRPVIEYEAAEVPGLEELKLWKFNDALQALYEITNRIDPEQRILELYQRIPVYLDGQNGNDSNDGMTPETAFKSLKRVYQYIQAETAQKGELKGIAVYVVDTVELSGTSEKHVELNNIMVNENDGTYHYEGSYRDDDTARINIKGQVYFKRYAQPRGYDPAQNVAGGVYEGYGKPTHKDSLFTIHNGGDLTLSGVYLDGHANDSSGINEKLTADGVEAEAPLITVTNGGTVHCKMTPKDYISNGIDTATLLTNNVNVNQKTRVIGKLYEGSPDEFEVVEGSAAGIELIDLNTVETADLPLPKADLVRSEFRNLKLGKNVASGASDVYSNGELHISNLVLFEGNIFLEGLGVGKDPSTYKTSRYIYADTYAYPSQDKFQVLLRDPYDTRTVVEYPRLADSPNREPDDQEKRLYLLEERVKDRFYVSNRESHRQILELRIPAAVYVDGIGGNDAVNPMDPAAIYAGSTPDNPIKTLGRAYSLLRTRGGGVIYVVNNPIQIGGNVTATGSSFKDETWDVTLNSSDKVRIMRYVQPDFARTGYAGDTDGKEDYQVPDYTGALLNVQNNGIANFSSNVIFDGHSEPRNERDDPKEVITSAGAVANAPLITVEKGGRLELDSGVILQNNHNTGSGSGHMEGGAVHNSGTTEAVGTIFRNTMADKGAGVYQDGIFTIMGRTEEPNLVFEGGGYKDSQFYLSTVNSGTPDNPVWGEDHVIQINSMIPDAMVMDAAYQVDMDHAVEGRDVVRFLDSSAYRSDAAYPGCDPEHEHFRLGSTVPVELFLVQSEEDETVLELQDWKVLHVEVPQDIYLAVTRKGSINSSTVLSSVQTGTPELFSAPGYQISNRGRYEVKVLLNGMDNMSAASGITHDEIQLKSSEADVIGEKDFYLSLSGTDTDGTDGFAMAETALQTGSFTPVEMGTLKAGSTGSFRFNAKAGTGFVDKYKDMLFPLTDTAETVQNYLDGTSVTRDVNARAKYLLKYRVEMIPPRN